MVTKCVPHFKLETPPPTPFLTNCISLIRKCILIILRAYLPNYINPKVVYWRLCVYCVAGSGLCKLFEYNSLLHFCKGFVVKHVNYSEFRDCGKLTKFLTQDKHLTYINL